MGKRGKEGILHIETGFLFVSGTAGVLCWGTGS